MALPLNSLINNRYILMRYLASGGMADIYEANDVITNKPVAIKFLKEKSIGNERDLEAFKNEARFTSMFSHPHILKVYNVGEYESIPFVSYELLKGKTLKEVLDNRGKLTFDEAIDYLLQIVDAVNYVHRAEVIHNDLKPDNLFLLNDGNIKLCDFGIASHTFDKTDNELFGSLNYVALEVLQSKKFSVQSDLYSLGVIFYELLTGKLPFYCSNGKELVEAQLRGYIPSLSESGYSNYRDLDYVISKLMDKNLLNRYKSGFELKEDLIKLKNHEEVKRNGIFSRLFK